MRALSLLSPGEACVIDVQEPPSTGDGLLMRVEMVGLCGSDLNSFRGNNPMIVYPRILGHEIAATVLEGNSNVPSGTRVTVAPYTNCGSCASCRRARPNACQNNLTLGVQRDGALTEFLRISEEKIFPSCLSLKELCLVEPLTVGVHAVSRGRVNNSDIVAVFGCGGVGLGAIAGAAFRGARTIAIDLEDEKLGIARAAGATDLINARRENLHDRLNEITGGFGPDVVIEAIGSPQAFQAAVEEVAFTGRVIYIGYAKQPVAYETKLFVQKELDILGSRNALPGDFREVISMMEAGNFPVDRAVTVIVDLDSVPDILYRWSANPAEFTKIVVQVSR